MERIFLGGFLEKGFTSEEKFVKIKESTEKEIV